MANIKKATIIAGEWLVSNEKPSGTNWDYLYAHLIENYEKINSREKIFTGFGNFICHTKYNDRGENLLNILSINDEDGVDTTSTSRASSRNSMKEEKNKVRAIEAGDSTIFNSRGYTIDSRIQMVEIAQFQDAQKMENIKNTLEHLTNRNKLLLDERLQQITIAKLICPEYNAENEQWKKVNNLSRDIENLKKKILLEESKKIYEMSNSPGKNMAERFLSSVTTEIECDGGDKSTPNKKRKHIDDAQETIDLESSSSPPSNVDTVEKEVSSVSSGGNSGVSNTNTGNAVS